MKEIQINITKETICDCNESKKVKTLTKTVKKLQQDILNLEWEVFKLIESLKK